MRFAPSFPLLTAHYLLSLSLNDFIGPLEHTDWNCQTDLFRCLEVDDELKLRCLLHWQVSRFGAFQDLVNVVGGLAEQVIVVRPVGHETPSSTNSLFG